MNRFRSLAALLCAVTLAACGKEAVQDITGPFPSARIRFFNFGPSTPGVNFYANATKMTAILSATGKESTNGIAYGGVSAGGAYSAIAPGQYTVTGKLADSANKDVVIASVPVAVADGKRYSVFLSGLYNATAKSVDAFAVEDAYTAPTDTTVAVVRFVNAISNANPMTLYAKNTATGVEVAIGGSTAYKAAGAFTNIPAGTYDLSTRYDGSSTNAITRTGVGFSGRRVYTITARGDITVTSSTATTRPILDNTANY